MRKRHLFYIPVLGTISALLWFFEVSPLPWWKFAGAGLCLGAFKTFSNRAEGK